VAFFDPSFEYEGTAIKKGRTELRICFRKKHCLKMAVSSSNVRNSIGSSWAVSTSLAVMSHPTRRTVVPTREGSEEALILGIVSAPGTRLRG